MKFLIFCAVALGLMTACTTTAKTEGMAKKDSPNSRMPANASESCNGQVTNLAAQALKEADNLICDLGTRSCSVNVLGYSFDVTYRGQDIVAVPFVVVTDNGKVNQEGNVLIRRDSCQLQYIQTSSGVASVRTLKAGQ